MPNCSCRRLVIAASLSTCLLTLLLLSGLAATAHGTKNPAARGSPGRICADVSNAGWEDGSPAAPFHSVAAALAVAQPGDLILIAEGIYAETLVLSRSVSLAGGYAAFTSPVSWTRDISLHVTTLDGHDAGSVITVMKDAVVSLDGLTLTRGRGVRGGGLRVEQATATLQDVIVAENHAVGSEARGGGVYVEGARLAITNTQLVSNTAASQGGGLYLLTSSAVVSGATIAGNTAWWDGGGVHAEVSELRIRGSHVFSNAASCCGGGIGASNAWVILDGNRISRNQVNPASDYGGGIYIVASAAVINANLIVGNRALAGGGLAAADFDIQVTNNLIADNAGGGILFHAGQIINNTIRDNLPNAYDAYGDGILIAPLAAPTHVTITNNIVASNTYGIGLTGAGVSVTLRSNDVWRNNAADYTGLRAGDDDISADPRLESLEESGYHLLPGSPCIDAGVYAGAPPADLDGVARPLDGDDDGAPDVDIGAAEYRPAPHATPTPTATCQYEPTPTATATMTPSPTLTPTAIATATPTPPQRTYFFPCYLSP
jgi:hypothetical protein